MLPIRRPEITSWMIVFTSAFHRPGDPRRQPDPESTLTPIRQRHHDRRLRCEFAGIYFLVTRLGPLPDADRGTQILSSVLGIVGPVEIGELDSAAVYQRSLGQIELQRDLAQLIWLEGLGFRQHFSEQRPDRRETRGGVPGRRAL